MLDAASSVDTIATLEHADALLLRQTRSDDEERQYRKERLAGGLRMLSKFGMNDGAAGHVTARDPSRPDAFWVNPALRNFGQVKVSDLLLVDESGRVLEGDGVLNKAAFAIHSRIHRARPDIVAAAHAHSTYGKIWSTTGRLLQPLTQDACAFYGSHALFDDYTGVVLDTAEGDRIATALGMGKAVILRNHGLLTVGTTVEESVWWFIAMEQAAQVQVVAETLGDLRQIDPDAAELTSGQVGSAIAGRLQFDCEWDLLVAQDDSFLD